MPRLNHQIESFVFFLYGIDENNGEITGPNGTGFLIAIGLSDHDPQLAPRHAYAITCHHVAVRGGSSIIRINTRDGSSRLIEMDPAEWTFDVSSDLATVDVTEMIDPATDDVTFLPSAWLASKSFIDFNHVGIGEEAFMIGLFGAVPGMLSNVMSGRFGNVSLIANDELLVEREDGRRSPAHIFDIRSRPGLSGSPVFVYRTPSGDIRQNHNVPFFSRRRPDVFDEMIIDREIRDNTFLKLLGVHSGQHLDTVPIRRSTVSAVNQSDAALNEDTVRLPSSMTIVEPAWNVLTLLDHLTLSSKRLRREEQDKSGGHHPVALQHVIGFSEPPWF